MARPFDHFVGGERHGRGLRLAFVCRGAAPRRRAGRGEEKVAMRDACLVVVDAQNDFMPGGAHQDRKSTRLNSSHVAISYAVFCLKKKIGSTELYAHKQREPEQSVNFVTYHDGC